MMLVLLILALVIPVRAAITNVRVVGTTNVQAILSYTAPSSNACSIEVSEKAQFSPLVHDVNPALFVGQNLDTRSTSASDGVNRFFVAGRRAVDQAADGKWYSRALQTDTPHFFRIRCGAETAEGAFRTATVPAGVTSAWPIPQDPATGNFRWPSVDGTDRNQTVIDPNYGTLIRRLTIPGEIDSQVLLKRKFAKAVGDGWTNPEASLADDGSAARNGAGNGWLALTEADTRFTPVYESTSSVDIVVVRIKGSAPGATETERTIEACVTINGTTCHSDILRVALDTRETQKTLGSGNRIDTWGQPLFGQDIGPNKAFGVLIRAAQAGAPVSVQAAEIDVQMSQMPGFATSGNFRTCAPVKVNGGYHCAYPGANGADANGGFWINPDTGEVRYLGRILARGWGGQLAYCLSPNALWDAENPNVYYCTGSQNGKQVLLRGTYTGNDVQVGRNAEAAMTWTNLTPGTQNVGDLLKAFDPLFDPAAFPCALAQLTGQYAVFQCLLGPQDSMGWVGVLDMGNRQPLGQGGTGKIVAAARTFSAPNTRWCTFHAVEPLIAGTLIGWTPQQLRGGGAGTGPHSVQLATALPASAGTFTVQVSGEPRPFFMEALAGDVFIIPGSVYDMLKITRKNSATEWVVERKIAGGAAPAVAAGATANAFCGAYYTDDPSIGATVYWDFQADPRAQNVDGKTWVMERELTGGHIVQRGNYRLQSHWMDGYQVVTPGLPASINQKPSYLIATNPKWGNVRPFLGLAEPAQGLEAYQSHPSYENYNAPAPERRNWFVDLIPFVGYYRLLNGITPVAGTAQVYKANGVNLHRNAFPTLAVCGGRMLKDISPGPIRDADNYSYCLGANCAGGAGPNDAYVSCPAPVTKNSYCQYGYFGNDSMVCFSDLPAYGQSVSQFFFHESGKRARVLTNALMSLHASRTQLILDTASPLPDGSWVVFPSYANNARKDLYMVKAPSPPQFDDSQVGQAVTVSVAGSPPSGATQARVEYGATPSLGTSTGAVSCASGCSIPFQAKPGDVVYTRVTYLDSAGRVIGQGPIEARITSGTAGSGMPKPVVARIRNAASADQVLAPGGIVTVTGENLAACTSQADSYPLATTMCGTSVEFNGTAGGLYYTSPDQVNVLLPSRIPPGQDVAAVVTREGIAGDPFPVPGTQVRETAPAIYGYVLPGETAPRAVIQQPDGTLNGPSRADLGLRPMRRGEAGVVYVNSMGPTNPSVPDGEATPVEPLSATSKPVSLYVNDQPQNVFFSGLTPVSSGLYQVNFLLDAATPVKPGDENRVWLEMEGSESPRMVIAVDPE